MRTASPLAAFTRALALVLALAALAPRLAAPAGYMIGRDARNVIAVTLCSAGGPADALLDLDTGAVTHAPAQAPARDDAPCPFSLAAPLAPALAPAALGAPVRVSFAAPAFARAEAAVSARAARTPPARGPPLFA